MNLEDKRQIIRQLADPGAFFDAVGFAVRDHELGAAATRDRAREKAWKEIGQLIDEIVAISNQHLKP